MIFYIELTKNINSFLSFHSPIFHKRRETFFERKWVNSLKGTLMQI